MAFGGYKFKGYKVVRANLTNNTYANWCLLVHQARIKAFMESCALSGAQWAFSKTNGDLSFESYGNVIYRVANANGDYHDYLSFFKYGSEELYYMLATLGEYYVVSTVGSPVLNSSSMYQHKGGSNTSATYKYAGYASALSLEPFPDNGPFDTYPIKALPCTSQLTSAHVNIYNAGVKEGTSGSFISTATTIYVGYATKGKDIITVTNNNKGCIESGDAFSSLCDPNDEYKIAKINLGYNNSSEVTTYLPAYCQAIAGFNNECLNSSGIRINHISSTTTSQYNILGLVPSGMPYLNAGGQLIPYSSAYLSAITTVRNSVILNSNSILVKGVIKNELLSTNVFEYTTRNQQPSPGTAVMGGNLITSVCVQAIGGDTIFGNIKTGYSIPGTITSGTYADSFSFPVAYVGWDPSNPNINDDSSWPELSLA